MDASVVGSEVLHYSALYTLYNETSFQTCISDGCDLNHASNRFPRVHVLCALSQSLVLLSTKYPWMQMQRCGHAKRGRDAPETHLQQCEHQAHHQNDTIAALYRASRIWALTSAVVRSLIHGAILSLPTLGYPGIFSLFMMARI